LINIIDDAFEGQHYAFLNDEQRIGPHPKIILDLMVTIEKYIKKQKLRGRTSVRKIFLEFEKGNLNLKPEIGDQIARKITSTINRSTNRNITQTIENDWKKRDQEELKKLKKQNATYSSFHNYLVKYSIPKVINHIFDIKNSLMSNVYSKQEEENFKRQHPNLEIDVLDNIVRKLRDKNTKLWKLAYLVLDFLYRVYFSGVTGINDESDNDDDDDDDKSLI